MLDRALRDYASTRFQNFRVIRVGDKITACGEVNARNAFGGYTGWQKIGVALNEQTVVSEAPGGYADYYGRCPGPTGSRVGVVEGAEDVTPEIAPTVQPVATP